MIIKLRIISKQDKYYAQYKKPFSIFWENCYCIYDIPEVYLSLEKALKAINGFVEKEFYKRQNNKHKKVVYREDRIIP